MKAPLFNWKKILIAIPVVLGLAVIGFIISLVLPAKDVSSHTIVRSQPNIIQKQSYLEQSLISDYANADYTPQSPYIVQDPYNNSPLTAFVMFETPTSARVSVSVIGKDDFTGLSYQFDTLQNHHEIPIIGLYPDASNQVTLTLLTEDGLTSTHSFDILTEPLPGDFPEREIVVSQPEKMEPGWTLVNSQTYKYLLDANGDVRWYLSFKSNNILTVLPDGHLLTAYLPTPPFSAGDPADKLVDTDLMGKFHTFYFTPLIHHDVIPYHEGYLSTVGEMIYEFDKHVGTLNNSYLSLWQFFPAERIFEYIDNSESLHHNALVSGGELEDKVLVSARNQHAVILVDYPDASLEWIMGTPQDWTAEFEPYLLQPVGEPFEWFWMQHAPQILPDQDQDPDTTDIVLFDNGRFRDGKTGLTEDGLYSRMVHYRVNQKDKTIEQIWEYGKERGFELYSSIKSSAAHLPQTGNYLGTFGEVQSRYDPNEFDGVITEVTGQKELVYEVRLIDTRTIYRAERVSMDQLIPESALGNRPGQYLKNDYPYKVYEYPEVSNATVAHEFSKSPYKRCMEKLGSDCELWMNRLQHYGLLKSVKYSPLEVEIDNLEMINSDVQIVGQVSLMEGQEKNLYLVLSNNENAFSFDISSALMGEHDDGRFDIFANYFNTGGLPAGNYEVSLYSHTSDGVAYALTNYSLEINASNGAE